MPCYKPDGSRSQEPSVLPCNQVQGTFSTCCATNHSAIANGVADDKCTPNGLCQNFITYPDGKTLTTFWRGTCSDPTWNSPNCLKDICFDSVDSYGNKAIQNCTDGTWCCGADETASCCSNGSKKIRLAATIGLSSTSSVASSTSQSPTSPATTSPSSNTPQPAAKGLSTGAKAGIGVGAAVGALVLILAALLIVRRMRRKNEDKAAGGPNQYEKAELDGGVEKRRYDAPMFESDARPMPMGPFELNGNGPPSEMPSSPQIHSASQFEQRQIMHS